MRLPAVGILLALAGFASADGLPMKDGRYDGPATVLELTPRQLRTLEKTRDLVLTASQKRRLKAAAGIAPSRLYVYFTKDGESDCTCFAYNLGLRFAPGHLEVPHDFLVNDKEAAKRAAEIAAVD